MSIRWASLIADLTGEVDYTRIRSLVSVVLATVGGLLAVWVVFHEVLAQEALPSGNLGIAVGALVLPLTGGKIADVVQGRSLSSKIQTGQAPDRRRTSVGVVVPPEAKDGE
jgi:NO-binding membrane sensor protein with MHYT domain